MTDWVYCPKGRGWKHEKDVISDRHRHFPENAVGISQKAEGSRTIIWFIGRDETWSVPSDEVESVNVLETGDQYPQKICNMCHCLLDVGKFAKNQNNIHGPVRRPSCMRCRTDIDKRAPKSNQAKQFEKKRPKRRK